MPHPTSRHKATTGELVQAGDPANNAVRVNIVAGAGSGGTAATDDAAFTVGGTSYTPVGGTYRSVLDSVDDGDGGVFAMTQTRAIFANIRDDAGDSAMDGANNALRVNIVAGAGSGGTAMTDDAAFTPAGTSITPIGAFFDDAAPDPVDEGDGGVVRMSGNRNLYTNIRSGDGAERAAVVLDTGTNDSLAVAIVDAAGNQITSFGGGTQYTEGDVDATITGTAIMWEDAADTLRAVSAAKPLPVDTELPAAITLSDTLTNPTITAAGGYCLQWDGSQWVRLKGGATNGTFVDLRPAQTLSDALGNPTCGNVGAYTLVWDGSQWVRVRQAIGTLNGAGTGIISVAPAAYFDDAAITTITENNAGHLRISTNRNLYTTIRDAAGNERGVNVTAGNALQADLTSVAGTAILTGGTAGSQGVGGLAAHAAAASGNPVYVGGRASTALPTDVGADGDVAALWTNRNGATVVAVAPHIGLNSDPYNLIHEAAQYTTTQTSTVLIAGGASEKLVVTRVQIQAGGTTAGTLQLYFGTAAFSRGTSRAIFDGEFAPSATLKPGVVLEGPFISGTNGDDLLVTTSAAINPLTINVWYYVVV